MMLSYLVTLNLKWSNWEFDQAESFATFSNFGMENSSTQQETANEVSILWEWSHVLLKFAHDAFFSTI